MLRSRFAKAIKSGCWKWIGAAVVCSMVGSGTALAQTTFGSSTTIVFPVIAATSVFTGQVTLYNPNGTDITVGLDYFDANNTSIPGSKLCNDIAVPANRSVQFVLATQCTLGAG